MLGCLAVAGLAYNQNSKAPDGKSPGGSVHGGKHQLMEECDIPATLIETDLRVQGMQRQSSSVTWAALEWLRLRGTWRQGAWRG
jgi:hypothetical protein